MLFGGKNLQMGKGKWCKKSCQKTECLLYSKIEVPYDGSPDSRVVFVGESPGPNELKEGKPFVGKAGQLIKSHLKKSGIPISDCFFMNSARCLIDKKKSGVKEITSILRKCRGKVESALKAIKPKVIVVLGDIALRQIIRKSGITKNRGKWLFNEEFNCYILPMFHPAYILRNMSMLPRFLSDVKMLRDFINNDYQPLKSTEKFNFISDGISLHTLAKLLKGKIIAIDTETQGLEWFDDNFLVISFSISHKEGTAYQVNLYQEVPLEEADFTIKWERKLTGKKRGLVDVGIKREKDFEKKISFLKSILNNEGIKKYMMSPYDMFAFYSLFKQNAFFCGIGLGEINNFAMDVQAAANILNENLYTMASLATLQMDFTTVKTDYNTEFENAFGKEDMLAAKKCNPKKFNGYACYDADVTRRVGMSLKKELLYKSNKAQAKYLIKFVMPTIRKTLFEMSKNGIAFDLKSFPKTRSEIKAMVDRMEARTLKLIPEKVLDKYKEDLKLSRGDILRDALYSNIGYGLPKIKENKTSPSIDSETRLKLLDIRGLSSNARKCIEVYGEFKNTHTLYTRNLKQFDKYVKHDGRIHSKFSLVKAVTGRMASSNPNLMNIPKRSKLAPKIRKLLCSSPGYLLLAADAAQAELRWIAHIAQDPTMIKVFKENRDIHTETAKALVSVPWDTLSPEKQKEARRNSKVVDFGLLYGMGIKGFMEYAKAEYGVVLSRLQAERWVNIFFNKYNKIPIYHRNTIAMCKRDGYIDSCFGKRRRLPEITSLDMFLRTYAERQAINHRIQSPSSDTVLIAGNDFIDQKYPFDEARIVLFIHDELIFEIKENLIGTYAKRIKYHMEHPSIEEKFGVKLSVPLKAEIKVGPNLKDLEEMG